MANRTSFKSREDWLAYQKEYRRTHRKRIREINKKWRQKSGRKWDKRNKKATSTHRKVYLAIKDGSLVKGACEICGSDIDIRAHHDDYDKPLDVRWLCEKHHRELHNGIQIETYPPITSH